MPEKNARAVPRTVEEAMKKAENMAVTPLEQFRWAEFMMAGNIEAILHIGELRKAWLLQACERIGNAPVRQGHPRDGVV